ncbi:unnamed protein product [Mytilus edulis]|uniref:Uncharacterized protein n=1 Tax=Mytilus edulis TaxID=6550 RepID=A0A8S3U6M2_MYTED|nr:unnamed protein product [Mytilus edulis]
MLILQDGRTPLMLAAEGGHLEVVTFLVTHGRGRTPLMLAAGRTPGGGDFPSHSRKSDGQTALHYAAEFGQIDVTKWLTDQGCSPWVKTKEGKTPYDLVKIYSYDNEERKRKKEEVMDFLKVLMTSLEEEEESELTNKASDTSPTGYAKATLSSLPSEQSAAAQSLPSTKSSNVPHTVKQMEKKMRTRMTKEEIRKKMEKVLKSGKYKMKVGRLIFWDFGGQYVYLTTHQTFMTFRALFLVVFDGSKDLHEQVPDVMCFPGQHMTPTPAGNMHVIYTQIMQTGYISMTAR